MERNFKKIAKFLINLGYQDKFWRKQVSSYVKFILSESERHFNQLLCFSFHEKILSGSYLGYVVFKVYNIWISHRGTVVQWLDITTAQLHSTKPEIRFCTGSNPARTMSEICGGEDLWQSSRLEIKLNTCFCQSTIPQKQFIIVISIYPELMWVTVASKSYH